LLLPPREMNASEPIILVVDDEPRNLKLVGAFLEKNGLNPAFAENGKQALAFLDQTTPDLILLDIRMPEMDGIEVCRRILQKPEWGNIPIIFLTAKTDQESLMEGLETGGMDYITKPFYGTELIARVRRHLKNGKKTRSLEQLQKMKEEAFLIIGQMALEADKGGRELFDRISSSETLRSRMEEILETS